MSDLDLSELPNDVIRAVTCETVQNQLKTRKYRMDISSASKAGENNFLGVVYRLSFSREDGTCSNFLILKVAPQDYQLRVQFLSRAMFLREIYLYEEVNNENVKTPSNFLYAKILKFITDFTVLLSVREIQRNI